MPKPPIKLSACLLFNQYSQRKIHMMQHLFSFFSQRPRKEIFAEFLILKELLNQSKEEKEREKVAKEQRVNL